MATMASGEAVAGKKVGTHNGSFHCDEALGCFMMRLTSKFSDAEIVRSRDPKVGVCARARVRERERERVLRPLNCGLLNGNQFLD